MLYYIEVVRRFVGIELSRAVAPGDKTICEFRHLLEEHELGAAMSAEIDAHISDQGVQVSGCMIIDAPSFTIEPARRARP